MQIKKGKKSSRTQYYTINQLIKVKEHQEMGIYESIGNNRKLKKKNLKSIFKLLYYTFFF